ncbi:hypothetical protein AGABI1DRAFT_125945 [Agaricus bisporus var. burnettii JB137-S8]|uniref:DJ-1/PfpI domain-containing protein n=1 Tax=Agaricus bisporus var. burnettii (strain JB137-S8 / ATCC MYA-4627 / FGSC 10392) TaxID=597362 RepID=K5Y1B5_AGABU|nr:uncharacterized protein AGABI1DRAFT_125945 [Agaricus bisporus var. burnettii JB137-S8]EKM81570.1 hypothetical protein AGABI1DRAFT_125945 [Agaricus bisporus var. burnettii JB137-S8]
MASPPPITKPISDLPLHFALVLFPQFQALDVFGPLDALNTMKRLYPDIPLRLSILSSTLSPVSTSSSPSPSSSSSTNDNSNSPPPFEQKILPTHTFTSPPTHPIHILIIPGGIGTRSTLKSTWSPVVDYLSHFFADDENVKCLKGVFTVCTGSIVLARVPIRNYKDGGEGEGEGGEGGKELKGILEGIKATTNKRILNLAKLEFPTVHWQAQARWVQTTLPLPLSSTKSHHSIQLWTTSGVSAGIDGIFSLISDFYSPSIADFITQVLEYERTTDSTLDPFACCHI